MTRNIFALQQNLALIIDSNVEYLDTARHFYNLLNYDAQVLYFIFLFFFPQKIY